MEAERTHDRLPVHGAGTGEAGSFHHLRDVPLQGRCCQGLACYAARADAPERWQAARAEPRVYCLGQCHAAPARAGGESRPRVVVQAREAVLLGNVAAGGVRELSAYVARGGGTALARARDLTRENIVAEIETAQLRGRGGAGFPAGRKWALVAAEAATPKYVVANADEGDPGSFSDRLLLEDDPFRLIEGMCIAARAVGATHGYIYLRAEYPAAAKILARALEQARAAGWFSDGCDIELVSGAGSYVSGEETALLNSIEGRRPEVRLRPPQITQHGLFGRPTLVNNVETFCAVPWIIERGGAAYAQLGFSRSRGTKLLSLASLFSRPGLYEVEFGISLREIVGDLGGGLRRGALRALMLGGPLAGLLPPRLLGTRLGYEEMQAVGAAVGHGGVIAFADDSPLAEIIHQVFRFGSYESCGKCVPCHRGTPVIEHMFGGAARERLRYGDIVQALAQTSLCAHGRGLAEFAQSLERHFAAELAACFA